MTATTMALTELAEKGADIDVPRQMVQFMARRLMELDVEARCGAGCDEKNPERINSRNGYRDRIWDTRAGSVFAVEPFAENLEYLRANVALANAHNVTDHPSPPRTRRRLAPSTSPGRQIRTACFPVRTLQPSKPSRSKHGRLMTLSMDPSTV